MTNETRTSHELKLTLFMDVLGWSSFAITDAVFSTDGCFFCSQAIDYTEAMVKRFLHICDVVNYGSLHIIIV